MRQPDDGGRLHAVPHEVVGGTVRDRMEPWLSAASRAPVSRVSAGTSGASAASSNVLMNRSSARKTYSEGRSWNQLCTAGGGPGLGTAPLGSGGLPASGTVRPPQLSDRPRIGVRAYRHKKARVTGAMGRL